MTQTEQKRINHRRYTQTEKGKATKMRGYYRRKAENPVRSKASRLSAKLGWGAGATDMLEKMFLETINTPCKWCGTIITVENLSLDHKQPIGNPKDLYPQERKALNQQSNLRIICKPCNQMKSNIPEEKFQKLVDWLKLDPILENHVLRRLRTSNLMWFSRQRK